MGLQSKRAREGETHRDRDTHTHTETDRAGKNWTERGGNR